MRMMRWSTMQQLVLGGMMGFGFGRFRQPRWDLSSTVATTLHCGDEGKAKNKGEIL